MKLMKLRNYITPAINEGYFGSGYKGHVAQRIFIPTWDDKIAASTRRVTFVTYNKECQSRILKKILI